MNSDPKTKPEEQVTVDDETPDDPKSRELTLEELASVSGGGDGDEDTATFHLARPLGRPIRRHHS